MAEPLERVIADHNGIADEQPDRGSSDAEFELREWAKKLGVSPEQIREMLADIERLNGERRDSASPTQSPYQSSFADATEYWKEFDKPAFIRKGLAFPKLTSKPRKPSFFDSAVAVGIASIFDFAGVGQAKPKLSMSSAVDKTALEQDFEVVAADVRNAIASIGRRRK